MRNLALFVSLIAALAGSPALALAPKGVPPGADPATAARPGNEIGTGMSLPRGNVASNINDLNTRSTIVPNLPSPAVSENATPAEFLRAAQLALQAGHSGEARRDACN